MAHLTPGTNSPVKLTSTAHRGVRTGIFMRTRVRVHVAVGCQLGAAAPLVPPSVTVPAVKHESRACCCTDHHCPALRLINLKLLNRPSWSCHSSYTSLRPAFLRYAVLSCVIYVCADGTRAERGFDIFIYLREKKNREVSGERGLRLKFIKSRSYYGSLYKYMTHTCYKWLNYYVRMR